MPDHLVITRPLAQATILAQQLRSAGREVTSFPLLDIAPLHDLTALREALGRLPTFAMVAFVSPNAIDAAFAHITAWPPEVALAVMGEGSRQALARHGVTDAGYHIFRPLDAQRTDSETLLAVLDLAALRHRQVLILRGESGRELLADALRAAEIKVEQVAAYRREAPVLTAQRRTHLAQLLAACPTWVISSSEALRNLLEMVEQVDPAQGVAKIQHQKVWVSHPRIAEAARALGFQEVRLTASGDDGLLTALQSCA